MEAVRDRCNQLSFVYTPPFFPPRQMGPLFDYRVYFVCLLAPTLFLRLGSSRSSTPNVTLGHHGCIDGAKCKEKCPSEWMFYEDTCYGVFTDVAAWDEAEATCFRYHQSHLASILDEEEMTAISKFVTTNYKSVGPIWIGLHDPFANRRWRWTDLSLSSYLSWNDKEPNGRKKKELCVHLVVNREYMRWNDAKCSMEMAFICKYHL
uniref:C-type lectin-like n=1 Tax=Pogona vitticeps TaxID=103695 RepID=A0ABM5GLH0_9SAUR